MKKMNNRMRISGRILIWATTMIGVSSLSGCIASGPPLPNDAQLRAEKSIKPVRLPDVPARVATPMNPLLVARSAKVIEDSLMSKDVVIRANAVEAAMLSKQPNLQAILTTGLTDNEPIVRFASAMAAGDARQKSLLPKVMSLANDTSPNVRVAVRYALHRMGDFRMTKDLETLSQNPSESVRSNVALVLGKLEEPSAVRVLRPMLNDESMPVRLAVAEGLWRYQDKDALEMLVAGVSSQFVDDQMISMLALAQAKDRRVLGYFLGRLDMKSAVVDAAREGRFYDQVELVAARGAGILGSDAGFGVAQRAAKSVDQRERVLSALALGDIGRGDAQATLDVLLSDPDASVRLAAASAVGRLALVPQTVTPASPISAIVPTITSVN